MPQPFSSAGNRGAFGVNTAFYGPSVGEFGPAQMFGPSGNRLGSYDVALSPDIQRQFPLGSTVYNNGGSQPFNVADTSYRSRGQPNANMVEFRNGTNYPDQVMLSNLPGLGSDYSAINNAGQLPVQNLSDRPSGDAPSSIATQSNFGGTGDTNSFGYLSSNNDVLDGQVAGLLGHVPYLGPALKLANLGWKVGGSIGNLFKGNDSSAPTDDPQSHTSGPDNTYGPGDQVAPPSSGPDMYRSAMPQRPGNYSLTSPNNVGGGLSGDPRTASPIYNSGPDYIAPGEGPDADRERQAGARGGAADVGGLLGSMQNKFNLPLIGGRPYSGNVPSMLQNQFSYFLNNPKIANAASAAAATVSPHSGRG